VALDALGVELVVGTIAVLLTRGRLVRHWQLELCAVTPAFILRLLEGILIV
jgi:hypothetical protein